MAQCKYCINTAERDSLLCRGCREWLGSNAPTYTTEELELLRNPLHQRSATPEQLRDKADIQRKGELTVTWEELQAAQTKSSSED